MAIDSFDSYKQRLEAPTQIIYWQKNNLSTNRGWGYWSPWLISPNAGSIPSGASSVCTNATAGAIAQLNSTNPQRLLKAVINSNHYSGFLLIDRLVHSGGLSGIVTGAQTTNLPTAALTRYATGAGVRAALEIYTTIGTSGTTFTASYTNEAGTAGRTTTPMQIGSTGYTNSGVFIPFKLQAGDTGVRSVESVTLAGSTGVAGDFGVVLYKPLMPFGPLNMNEQATMDALFYCGVVPEILNNACLQFIYTPNAQVENFSVGMKSVLYFSEE